MSFRWGAYDPSTGKRERNQVETLPASEFLRRYLQHIPPPYYQTVRHYGLYTSAKKMAYEQCCEHLKDANPCVRYWGATGCVVLGQKALAAEPELTDCLGDSEPVVQLQAARALAGMGRAEAA